MPMEIVDLVDLPIRHGDVPEQTVSLPEGSKGIDNTHPHVPFS